MFFKRKEIEYYPPQEFREMMRERGTIEGMEIAYSVIMSLNDDKFVEFTELLKKVSDNETSKLELYLFLALNAEK